jgi:hypothetical protein
MLLPTEFAPEWVDYRSRHIAAAQPLQLAPRVGSMGAPAHEGKIGPAKRPRRGAVEKLFTQARGPAAQLQQGAVGGAFAAPAAEAARAAQGGSGSRRLQTRQEANAASGVPLDPHACGASPQLMLYVRRTNLLDSLCGRRSGTCRLA